MTTIKTKGFKDPKIRSLFKKAAKEITQELCGSRMNLNIQIEYANFDSRAVGTCTPQDEGPNPRDFEIEIDNSNSLLFQLKTLAHELVHMRQFARNEMYDYMSPHVRFKGEIFPSNTPYSKQPWEHEARKLEASLIRKFLKEHNINLKDYK